MKDNKLRCGCGLILAEYLDNGDVLIKCRATKCKCSGIVIKRKPIIVVSKPATDKK